VKIAKFGIKKGINLLFEVQKVTLRTTLIEKI